MENVPPNIFNIMLADLPANWIKLSWKISQKTKKNKKKKNKNKKQNKTKKKKKPYIMKANSMSSGLYQN